MASLFYWDLKRLSEGHTRWRHDAEEYKRLVEAVDSHKVRLNHHQNLAIARAVIQEADANPRSQLQNEARMHELARDNRTVTKESLRREAADVARKAEVIPGRPDIIEALMQAQTTEQVRAICADAFAPRIFEVEVGVTRQVMMPNWPISPGSTLPGYLSEYAAEFLAARNNRRFPRSEDRPSNQLKQLWFFSRALAGALYGVKTRTAINLVGSRTPEQIFEDSRAGKRARKLRR